MRYTTTARITTISILFMLAGTSAVFAADSGIPTIWDPGTVTTGNLAGSAVTMIGTTDSFLEAFDLSGADYAAAPLSPNTVTFTFDTGSDWTATFSPPVNNLLLYVVFWRGFFGGPPNIITYDFDQPFTVLSGLGQTTVSNGNTRLSIPDEPGIFEDGILEFTGPVSSLSVETNSVSFNAQALTFGIFRSADLANIPTLSEWGMITMAAVLGLIGFMVVRRRDIFHSLS